MKRLLDILENSRRAVVVGHKNPDGDSLGSCLVWAQVLREVYGVEAATVVPDGFPDFLRWLPGIDSVINYERKAAEVEKLLNDADVVFCLDFNEPSRVGAMEDALLRTKAPKVLIDHHLDPDIDALVAISDPTKCSTCELIYTLMRQLGISDRINKDWATLLYCGMMTDTGGFTYNSSRAELYDVVSELLSQGIDKDEIYRNVYHNYSSWAVRFRGYIMSQKLNVYDELHASYFAISREEMRAFHFVKGDAEGLVNVPLTIKGMRLSISLREDTERDNCVWVSLRSQGDFPANVVAERFFGGGGHVNAAGGHLEASLDEAEKVAREAIKAFEKELKNV